MVSGHQIKISFSALDRKGYTKAINIVLVYTPSLAEIYNITKAAI